MGARKEGFKKRAEAGIDRGCRIVRALVKSKILTNELIFYFGGTFEFRILLFSQSPLPTI